MIDFVYKCLVYKCFVCCPLKLFVSDIIYKLVVHFSLLCWLHGQILNLYIMYDSLIWVNTFRVIKGLF